MRHVTKRDLIEILRGVAKGLDKQGKHEEARKVRSRLRLIDHKDGWKR